MTRPHGRARVSATNPQAFASCDRCGTLVNRVDLRPEMQMRGPSVKPTGFLVCARCEDKPNESTRTVVLGPDPVPVKNPRRVQYS